MNTHFTLPQNAEIVYADGSYVVRHLDLYGKGPQAGILTNEEQTRGVVFKAEDLSDQDIICKVFPNTRELIEEFPEPENIKNYNWTVAKEMNSLSLFFDNGEFHLKTTKQMDAFRSHWIDELSFGRIFVEALKNFEGTNPFNVQGCTKRAFEHEREENVVVINYLSSFLDKSRTYTFSLPFTGFNSLICTSPPHPVFYYCGSFSKDGKEFTSAYDEKDPFLVSLPKQDLLSFETTENLLSFVKNLPKELGQGIIGIQKTTSTPIVVKIYNKEYKEEYDRRMKQNDLIYEYLQIRTDDPRRQNFLVEYPELTDIIEEYDAIIDDITDQIFSMYQMKFVKKQELPIVHQLIWKIIRDLHSFYCKDRKRNIIRPEVVQEKVDSLSANDIRRLVLNFMLHNTYKDN